MESLFTKIKKTKKPILILICGMPGSRKSSTAIQLAASLNWQIAIGTDEIREIMKKYDSDPFLQGVSHNRWRLLGKKTDKNFLLGFLKHCRKIKEGIKRVLKKSVKNGENLIIEGVHLVPELYKNLKSFKKFHFVFAVKSLSKHQANIKNKISRRHGKQKNEWTKKEQDLLKIQNYLTSQTKKINNTYLFESCNPQENTKKIIKILKQKL